MKQACTEAWHNIQVESLNLSDCVNFTNYSFRDSSWLMKTPISAPQKGSFSPCCCCLDHDCWLLFTLLLWCRRVHVFMQNHGIQPRMLTWGSCSATLSWSVRNLSWNPAYPSHLTILGLLLSAWSNSTQPCLCPRQNATTQLTLPSRRPRGPSTCPEGTCRQSLTTPPIKVNIIISLSQSGFSMMPFLLSKPFSLKALLAQQHHCTCHKWVIGLNVLDYHP